MTRTLTLTSCLLFAVALSTAQDTPPFNCLANDLDLLSQLHANDPEAMARMAADEAELEAFTQQFVEGWSEGQRDQHVISVVFHVIHDNGPENISDEQIIDCMRVLNEDFNRENSNWQNVKPEFLPLVADVGIEFRLARKDPQGSCTNGITRTESILTYEGEQSMKSLIQWPRSRYMNVWVSAAAGGAAGYTNYPGAFNNFPQGDGIVVKHDYIGSIGTSSVQRSHVLTHEVGHWLNLRHVWGNSNEPGLASNCDMDDNVTDTPNTIGWTGCALNGVTCGSLDNVENFMDYAYCYKMFTVGQGVRMLAALNANTAQRSTLWQNQTLELTGVLDEPLLCMAALTSSTNEVCEGGSVTFTDVSYHGVQSRTWDLPGGTPSTSTDPQPVVTYAQAGVYPVTLTVSDATGSMSVTMDQAITVLSEPGAPPPIMEGFEGYSDLAASPWAIGGGQNEFALSNIAAYSGDNSVRKVNTSAMDGTRTNLISETYDMSDAVAISISFRHAYAQRNSANDDRLRIYVSGNCGDTWSLRKQLRGINDLNTGGTMGGVFVPNGPDQWGHTEITNVSNLYHTGSFRLRFEFESDGGNYLYLDDININGMPVGVDEPTGTGSGVIRVFPNPAEGLAQVLLTLTESGPGRLSLLDVLGREMAVLHEGTLPAGSRTMDLPISMLQSGVYLLRLQQGEQSTVVRFVVK